MSENRPAIIQKRDRFGDLVAAMAPKIRDVLPRHLTTERILAIVRAEAGRNPKLYECSPASVALCVMQAAELGLELSSVRGHAYPVPRENRRAGTTECTLQIGYKGLLELARRSGEIADAYAYAVHERDEWSYQLGLDRDLRHIPASGDRGDVVAAYAVVRTRDGGLYFEVLQRSDIESRRKRGAGRGAWETDYAAMARKSAIRALLMGGTVPMSSELQSAVEMEEEPIEVEASAVAPAPAPGGLAALGLYDAPADDEPEAGGEVADE